MSEIKTSDRKKKRPRRKGKRIQFEIRWNLRYLQLKDFKKRFGHCNVPHKWPENISLGRWVIRQRVYKYRLLPDRIEKLDHIGFSWNTYDQGWEESFRELQAFKEKFGHCDVTREYTAYLKLREWVAKQRKDKKQNQQRLTREKIAKLEALGFTWGFIKPGWQNQYLALVKFQQEHGHCRVVQGSKTHYTLGNWVSIQRSGKDKLTEEQVEKLNAIGFTWFIGTGKYKNVV